MGLGLWGCGVEHRLACKFSAGHYLQAQAVRYADTSKGPQPVLALRLCKTKPLPFRI